VVHPKAPFRNLQPAVPKRIVIMQSNTLVVIVQVSDFTAENAKKIKAGGLDSRCYSLPDVFVLVLESNTSVVGGARAKVYGRVEGDASTR